MYSDKTIWLNVEEVVPRNDAIEIGFREEIKQKCKYVRVSSSDKEFPRENIYVIPVNAMRKHRINLGYGSRVEYFVHKDDIDLILLNEARNYTSIIDVKSEKLCDEHRGVPRLEYV